MSERIWELFFQLFLIEHHIFAGLCNMQKQRKQKGSILILPCTEVCHHVGIVPSGVVIITTCNFETICEELSRVRSTFMIKGLASHGPTLPFSFLFLNRTVTQFRSSSFIIETYVLYELISAPQLISLL
jgi:hypothetical protein